MTRTTDMEQLCNELVEACSWGEEARARALVSKLGTQPRKARALLEAMLKDADAQVRQAAAFGLGELGGAASVRLLEQQLAIEEARGDYDGASVAEAITTALGRIDEAGARTTLARKLERLATGRPQPGEVSSLAQALWRRRHPELLPFVQQSLERLDPRVSSSLQGLRVLLEKTPGELRRWARDPSAPLEHKTSVMTVLEEEVPAELRASLPAFIAEAHALVEAAVGQQGEASYYCERLLSLLLSHREQLLPALPEEARADLRAVALRLVASVAPNCAGRATLLLQLIGQPQDADIIEAHRPAEPLLARAFDDAARALRSSKKG